MTTEAQTIEERLAALEHRVASSFAAFDEMVAKAVAVMELVEKEGIGAIVGGMMKPRRRRKKRGGKTEEE